MAFIRKEPSAEVRKRREAGMLAAMNLTGVCKNCRAKSSQQRLASTDKGLLCSKCADELGVTEQFMEKALQVREAPKPEAPKPQSFGGWS